MLRDDWLQSEAQSGAATGFSPVSFETLLDLCPLIAYSCSIRDGGRIVYMSRRHSEVLAADYRAFPSLFDLWEAIVHPDDLPVIKREIDRLAETGALVFSYRVRNASGAYQWIEDRIYVLYDGAGEPTDLIGYWNNTESMHQMTRILEATLGEACKVKLK